MAERTLVIVESPAKARTLGKILGRGFSIAASMGHVMDLPRSKLGIDLENGFEPQYIPVRGKTKILKELKAQAARSDRILLASDPDREGEAIAWHLAQLLGVNGAQPCRIRMYEITPKGVKEAVASPEPIDTSRVDAQQARRVLDRIVGYSLSPLLWKKIQPRLSAGRVQSVALRLLAEREREIEAFVSREYWLVDVDAEGEGGRTFSLRLEKRSGKNWSPESETEARSAEATLRQGVLTVSSFREKESRRPPLPPFKTSTLQQEAARRLSFAPRKTMTVAQQLYEGVELPGRGPVGLITYMRTDSLRLSGDALAMARRFIEGTYGTPYVPPVPMVYVAKGRSQDAHEAIRVTDVTLTPAEVRGSLSGEQYKLYDLIWRRFVACQMAAATVASATVEATCDVYGLKHAGARLLFDGWGKVWPLDLKEETVATAQEGETLEVRGVSTDQRFTTPPARFAESGVIKALEEKGIGRPSTYATIIQTLYDRGYVERNDEKRLQPTGLGLAVSDFLVAHFPGIVNTQFTAGMEEELDEVEEGRRSWRGVVENFWNPFSSTLTEAEKNAQRVVLPVREIGEACPECGAPLIIKRGRFGEFIACSGYPQCRFSRPLLKTIGVACPSCQQGDVVRRRSRKGGRVFYGCSRFPTCDFVSWLQPTGGTCPDCGGFLAVRGRSKAAFCPACAGIRVRGESSGGVEEEASGAAPQETGKPSRSAKKPSSSAATAKNVRGKKASAPSAKEETPKKRVAGKKITAAEDMALSTPEKDRTSAEKTSPATEKKPRTRKVPAAAATGTVEETPKKRSERSKATPPADLVSAEVPEASPSAEKKPRGKRTSSPGTPEAPSAKSPSVRKSTKTAAAKTLPDLETEEPKRPRRRRAPSEEGA